MSHAVELQRHLPPLAGGESGEDAAGGVKPIDERGVEAECPGAGEDAGLLAPRDIAERALVADLEFARAVVSDKVYGSSSKVGGNRDRRLGPGRKRLARGYRLGGQPGQFRQLQAG